MYYIKNAPETLPLPEIFENMRFPLPLRAPNSLDYSTLDDARWPWEAFS
jgi:hypothetical protein